MEKQIFLTYASSLTDIREVNSSFDSGILQVAYHGKNRNKTEISKSAFERAIKTMFNCPLVTNYDRDTDTLGGHDIEIVHDNGSARIVNITTPVGCVPESAKYFWKDVEEDDGTVHEYLCVEVLLWKRQEAYEKIKRNGVSAHSMEINVIDSELNSDGYYQVNDFEFTAFAIIGVEPCFESASLHLFSKEDFSQQFSLMMQDLKETFSVINPSIVGNDNPNNFTEGGNALDNDNILTPEPDNDGASFALNSSVREEIFRAIEDGEQIEREWGICPRYCFADYDGEVGEVYCWDTSDWLLYGFAYEMNGDNVVIDWESKKRKKYVIADFDEGEQDSPFAGFYSKMVEFVESKAEFEAKFNDASASLKTMGDELVSLREFKAETILENSRNEKFALLGKFSELKGVEAYENLKSDDAGFDLNAIEEKCFAIKGRLGIAFSANTAGSDTTRIPVVRISEDTDEPYNGLFKKHGYK